LRRVRATAPLKQYSPHDRLLQRSPSPSRSRDGSIEAVFCGYPPTSTSTSPSRSRDGSIEAIWKIALATSKKSLRRVRATAPLKLGSIRPVTAGLQRVSVAFARRLH